MEDRKKIDPYNEEDWNDNLKQTSPGNPPNPWENEDIGDNAKPPVDGWQRRHDAARYANRVETIGNIIIGTFFGLILFCFVFFPIRCATQYHGPNTNVSYVNEWVKIINKDFKNKSFLIQRIKDTIYYAEIVNATMPNLVNNWDSLYYNKKVGDKMFFRVIKKDRFFKAKNGIHY